MMKENFLNGINERIIKPDFYKQDAVSLARHLLGTIIVRKTGHNYGFFMITETEAYLGEEDKACHCSKGKTERTKVMYEEGGTIYIYLIYGMYWMLNIVSGIKEKPEAVLIRGITEINPDNGEILNIYDGPGKTGKALKINKEEFNGRKIYDTETGLFIIENPYKYKLDITTAPRVGINYAGEPWISKPWRFICTPTL